MREATRRVTSILCVALIGLAPVGQERSVSTWERLSQLEPNVLIAVAADRTDGEGVARIEGHLVGVTSDSITALVNDEAIELVSEEPDGATLVLAVDQATLKVAGAQRRGEYYAITIPRGAIGGVLARTGGHGGRKGALLGAIAFYAAFALIAASAAAAEGDTTNWGSVLGFGVLGVPIGAGLGYYWGQRNRDWEPVYQRAGQPTDPFVSLILRESAPRMQDCMRLRGPIRSRSVLGKDLLEIVCETLAEQAAKRSAR